MRGRKRTRKASQIEATLTHFIEWLQSQGIDIMTSEHDAIYNRNIYRNADTTALIRKFLEETEAKRRNKK